jgi:CHAT domain-containing protein/Tfp pilus assembly protein PilF
MFNPDARLKHRSFRVLVLACAVLCLTRMSHAQADQRPSVQTLVDAKALFDEASRRLDREDLTGAEPLLKEAVEIQRRLAPGSVDLARSLTALGNVMRARSDLAGAAPLLREAVSILERLAPDSADFAVSLNNLGNLRWRQSALDEAESLFTRAFAILERTRPASADAANSLMGIGIAHYLRGRLADAESYFRRVLAIYERVSPGTAREARVLNNLGGVMYSRGDLLAAEGLYLRALAIHERVASNSQEVASTLHNIGLTYDNRGDRARAADYVQRALDMKERLNPGGLNSASSLETLANIARDKGDPRTARSLLQRALAIRERHAPGSLGVATVLVNLGNNAMDLGDLDQARERYEPARRLLEKLAPAGLEMATLLDRLVALALRRGDTAADVDRLAADALAITERVAPGSAAHAYALRRVGRLARDRGELDRAATVYSQALDAVEAQNQRLGGSYEVRTAFAGQRRAMYLEYTDILMKLGQSARAFDVLERSRARGLLMMLAERDLVLDRELPAELKDAVRQLREQDDRLQALLARLDPAKDAEELDRGRERQRELRARRAQITDKVRAASPRLAALQNPQALTLAQVQQALDPGTVLLSYQIGVDESRLFVVRRSTAKPPEQLSVHTLPIGEAKLGEQVRTLARLIERDTAPAQGAAPAFVKLARRLYDLLVAPAGSAIAAADRVLILPDGPLHSLPFAALVRPGGGSGGRNWQYLVEWKPLHTALSATVYAELRESPRASGPRTLVAFGDPHYPGSADSSSARADAGLEQMRRRGFELTPLPATRTEVSALARGFGEHATVYLGAEATEARAKSIAKTTYLHFATHGLLDSRSPLDSALALTLPAQQRSGEENGLLQAWEIFEQMRIDADLVTLSACETALGREVAGEGLVGLTRAFHYAGARSVLASLWRVADQSTSDLMTRFYDGMRDGLTKDEALRRAQLAVIAKPSTAAPFHWAAFTLSGDWR